MARRLAYPLVLLGVYVAWWHAAGGVDAFTVLVDHAEVAITMIFGSFVAGSTAAGGSAVAFPVFTKVLAIPPETARTFGLLIQAVGMNVAGVFILTRGIRVLPGVIGWTTLGSAVGITLGSTAWALPGPYARVLFTFVAGVFGVALWFVTFGLRLAPVASWGPWTHRRRAMFVVTGVVGGLISAHTGSGVDMLAFIVMTLAFGIDERISTPTTVIIMGLTSAMGAALHGVVLADVAPAWDLWMAAIPVVVIGAPMGAWVASRVPRLVIIVGLLLAVSAEVASTLLLVPMTPALMISGGVGTVGFGVVFAAMIRHRRAHQASSQRQRRG